MHPVPTTGRPSLSGAPLRSILSALLLALLWPPLAGCDADQAEGGPAKRSSPPVFVELSQLQPEQLRDVVALTGQLEAEDAVVLKPEIPGVIDRVEFKEGQAVKQGDVLYRLQDREQRARLAEARAELALAQDVFERAEKLANRDVSSNARRAEAVASLGKARARVDLAELALARTTIRAPFDGVAGLRLVSPGGRVNPDVGLVEIFSVDRLQLIFSVQEIGVPLARVGVPVSARVIAWPGESFPGEVFFVAPDVDPAARRLILKAWIDNHGHRLKPGMFANIDVEIARKEAALLVPEASIVYDRHGTYVWRSGDEGRAEKVPVEIGLRQKGRTEILAGLTAGDVIVSAGTHKVMAGSLLRAAGTPDSASAHQGEEESAEEGPRGAS